MAISLSAAAISLAFFTRVSCLNLTFPKDFVLGAVTSSYQSEGAWNISDKAESIYDRWVHTRPDDVIDRSNGDVTCDSYHKNKEDVQLLVNLGVDAYRFAISWARLLPNGYANHISEEGLAYYKNLTQELVNNGIKPIVTLHHMDHPQSLEDMGGWTNDLMVDLFAEYARVVFEELGPMVDTFITINQPFIVCYMGYELESPDIIPPAKFLGNYARYLCMHNVLKAHAKAWHIYDEEYRPKQKGKVGLVQSCFAFIPLNASNPDDVAAAEYGYEFQCGWTWHPLYLGDYPPIMRTRIDRLSRIAGYPSSRLPQFTPEEIEYIKGTTDFLGINYYRTYTARMQTDEEFAASPRDDGIIGVWLKDLEVVADGLISLLHVLRDKYNDPPVIITENGYSDTGGLQDYDRISYFHTLVSSVLKAVHEDGCNVVGYLIWSLMDDWELFNGFTSKFGLYSVDFNDPNRTRTPKLSMSWWKKVMETRQLQPVPQRITTVEPEIEPDVFSTLLRNIYFWFQMIFSPLT